MTPEQSADLIHRLISQLSASTSTLRGCAIQAASVAVKNALYDLCDRNDLLLRDVGLALLADNPAQAAGDNPFLTG